MSFDLDQFRWSCDIGYRVEVHDQLHIYRNSTFDGHGNMVVRDPHRHDYQQACWDHLSARTVGGPFMSFFRTWQAALRRWQRMRKLGAQNVFIVAVWLKGLGGVYDAYEISQTLRFGSSDPFLYEILVHGGISAQEYRILAVFRGSCLEDTVLCLDEMIATGQLPNEFLAGTCQSTVNFGRYLPDCTDRLWEELYMRTGTKNIKQFLGLGFSIAGWPYVVSGF
jgi:hypothetical protein